MDLVSAGRALNHPNERHDPHSKWHSRRTSRQDNLTRDEENRRSRNTSQRRSDQQQTDQNRASDESMEDLRDAETESSSSDEPMTDFLDEGLSQTRTLQLEHTMTMSGGTEASKRHTFISEAVSQGSRMSKKLINLLIWLPTDLSLSLSKGFHNAPKLYHDRMVKATPKVIGVRSGFRAAGQVRTTCPLRTGEKYANFVKGIMRRILRWCYRPNNPASVRLPGERGQRNGQGNWKGNRRGIFQATSGYVQICRHHT